MSEDDHHQRTNRHSPARRADEGRVRLTQRDIDGLMLCAEHGGAPYELLAAALGVTPARLRAIVTRWRQAGLRRDRAAGSRPGLVLAHPGGDDLCGLDYPATRTALARLAHCGRCWRSASTCPAGRTGRPTRSGGTPSDVSALTTTPPALRTGPDAEIHWPSREGQPNEGQVWAIEVELTPKQIDRAIAIMDALLDPASGYDRVIYYAARPAQPVLDRAAATTWPATARSPSPTSPPPPLCPACPDHRLTTTIIMTDNGTGNNSNNISAGASKRPVNTAGNSRPAISGTRVISYYLSEEERPGGIKMRFNPGRNRETR